jgi:proteasome lid subunit RPN8/RPN11
VIVGRAVLDAVVAHARDAAPAECCGLLLGTLDAVTESRRARNLADDPNRFLIDPGDHIDARRDARTRGIDVVGFYHSHPHSAAVPSERDLAEASYAGYLYLIVSLAEQPPAAGFYRLETSGFREEKCEIQ